MSTTLAEAPASTDSPVDYFYGKPSAPKTDSPDATTASPSESEPSSAATPATESVATADPEKPAPKEAETKRDAEESHRAAARRLGRQVQNLEQTNRMLEEQIRILQAKADGTYEEPTQPTPEAIAAQERFAAREELSREEAITRYGEEKVHERIYAKDSEYERLIKDHPEYHLAVTRSSKPTLEAWRVLELHAFQEKYGADPTQWAEKIIAEAKPVLLEELKRTIKTVPVGGGAPTVTQARGDGGPSAKERSLLDVFYGPTSRAS